MSDLLARAVAASPLPVWHRHRNRASLPILMYHGVVERPLVPACWQQLPVAAFRRQVEWVGRRFRVLPLVEALDRMREGTLPPRSCALTFDDGFENDVSVAAPILARLGLPATVFVVTDLLGTTEVPWPDRLYLAFARTRATRLDGAPAGLGVLPLGSDEARGDAYVQVVRALKALEPRAKDGALVALTDALGAPRTPEPGEFRLMTWEQAIALDRGGLVGIAAHTRTHEILARLPTVEAVRDQVIASQRALTARLGRAPRVFAYPNGRAVDVDDRAKAAVVEAGIPWALTTVEGFATAAGDPLALPRLPIGSDLSFARFRLLVSGTLAALRR